MASLTTKTRTIRNRKKTNAGKARKKAARKGTTPKFAVHPKTTTKTEA